MTTQFIPFFNHIIFTKNQPIVINTTLDRLMQIENERQQTITDPGFQEWVRLLGVSIVYKDREPIHNANEMNRGYDFSLIKKYKLF